MVINIMFENEILEDRYVIFEEAMFLGSLIT